MSTLIRFCEQIHKKILIMRSMETIINSPRFARLWKDSNMEQLMTVRLAVRSYDKFKLQKWVRQHPSLDVSELPVKRLREIAQEHNIYNYSRLSKLELIRAIDKKEDTRGIK